jgi:hypothetical protein
VCNFYQIFLYIQVILDLGHVTLSNVSDWSEENDQSSSQPQVLQDIDEDEDDGKRKEGGG